MPPMVIAHVLGGLGNQMFQYAAARAMSIRLNAPLALDLSSFGNYSLHQGYELGQVFSIPAPTASAQNIRHVLGWQAGHLVKRFLSRAEFAALRRKSLCVEPYFHYWPGIDTIALPAYLAGYWQSEKYFLGIENKIREEFSFKSQLSDQNKQVVAKIKNVTTVSLHVRRGDYANNLQTLSVHGLTKISYYLSAIKHIKKHVQNPHFFIFSDDIAWTKENLQIDAPHDFVNHNHGAESYNDMRLMSMCQHHIIANSSFSWWGAWLNPQPRKIVVAPAQWFAGSGVDTRDLLPAQWTKL